MTPDNAPLPLRPPSPMEFGSMPIDPFYVWGISYEPVEVLIERTSAYIEALADEAYQQDKEFTPEELVERFQAFFRQLVAEGVVTETPAPPEERKRWKILTPRQWAHAQNARIKRIVAWRKESEEESKREEGRGKKGEGN